MLLAVMVLAAATPLAIARPGELLVSCGRRAWIPTPADGLPLHQAREFGLHDKLFDLLDELSLVPSQVKAFCELLLGCGPLPDPDVDWDDFEVALTAALTTVPLIYDPLTATHRPWIDVPYLRSHFGPQSGRGFRPSFRRSSSNGSVQNSRNSRRSHSSARLSERTASEGRVRGRDGREQEEAQFGERAGGEGSRSSSICAVS
mmetsp:Transcript_69987/g.138762  ORF Transcript_69987/g.138762 Transcript_69987/m.138762 type:complete len:203 (+) Transcript_69987:1027-1635(+)